MHIRKSMQRIPNLDNKNNTESASRTKIIIDNPKTNNSVRKIPIPSVLLPVFKQYQSISDFYVLTGSVLWLEPKGYYRKYKRIMRKCGLEHFNYHALRHTFATVASSQGAPLFDIGKALGHSTPATTGKIYTHLVDQLHTDTLARVAAALQ